MLNVRDEDEHIRNGAHLYLVLHRLTNSERRSTGLERYTEESLDTEVSVFELQ